MPGCFYFTLVRTVAICITGMSYNFKTRTTVSKCCLSVGLDAVASQNAYVFANGGLHDSFNQMLSCV